MRRHIFALIILLALLIAVVQFPQPAQASTITVDGNCTLIDAIIAANTDAPTGNCPAGNDADTIVLDVDVNLTAPYLGSTDIGGGQAGLPDITTDITIEGNLGDTIAGNSTNFRIFNVTAGGRLTLNNVTITGGKISSSSTLVSGGAIYVDSNVINGLTVNDVTMTNNVAEGSGWIRGGAVYLQDTNLIISGSSFTNNSVVNLVGGWATGGALEMDSESGEVIAENSLFENNLVVGGNGGSARGGAISNEGFANQTYTGLIFKNNKALGNGVPGTSGTAYGGAIFGWDTGAAFNLSDVVFESNIAQAGIGSTAQGGAVWAPTMFEPNWTDVTFTGNQANGGDGTHGGNATAGAAFIPYSYFLDNGMSNVTFINNSANGGDGTLSGGDAEGGALYFESDVIFNITNITFSGNQANGGDAPGGTGGDGLGGAIGGIFYDLRFVDSIFDSNIARGGSGDVGGDAQGGAQYFPLLAYYDRVDFTNNQAIGGTGTTSDGVAQGGAIYSELVIISITNSTIDSNQAISSAPGTSGGAFYTEGGADPPLSTGLIGNTISNNYTTGKGGGAYLYVEGLIISGNTFFNNSANEGGGVYGRVAGSELTNNTFSANSAVTGGGLILEVEGTIAIYHNTFLNNTASITADNIYIGGESFLDVKGNIFATNGGTPDCFIDEDGILTAINNLHVPGDTSCDVLGSLEALPATFIDTTLQNNGGPTDTHALLIVEGNPAWNSNPNCGLATDQRGGQRDTNCDLGAYEIDPKINNPGSTLIAWATCVHPNLEVSITSGDGDFEISALAGINVPVTVGLGTSTITGPEKWDDLTVTELSGNGESINLGQFKCRPLDIPVPVWPPHQGHVNNAYPLFVWNGIPDANNYRLFVFDDKVAANRTVDVRENSGGATQMQLSTPLPPKRLFWRVRARVNSVWGYWSIRYTLFIDPPTFDTMATPVPTVDLSTPVVLPTVAPTLPPDGGVPIPSPNAATATVPAPPNPR